MTPLQELKLINRAVRNRWDVPAEEMQKTIDRVVYLRDNAEDEATQMAAIRAIVSMVGQNQKDEHKVIDVRVQTRHDELAGIAADLGIEVGAIEDATRQTDSSTSGIESQSVPEKRRR
jgi:hypothetical protein